MKIVAVIGAGPCGLTAIKACREENLDVVCFEKTGQIGGLWRYHDEDKIGKPSVMRSTIINSHKEMSAYTDFPPPAEFPSYMHHSQLLRYIEMYAEHFNLHSCIRFNQEVLSVRKHNDYDETGRWVIQSKSLENNDIVEEIYDGVMVCTGHHAFPSTPKLPGLDVFQGKKIHSHSLKNSDGFKDLRVLVVGAGNSGADVAVELSEVAKQVYISARKGMWVVPRRGPLGLPFDLSFTNRLAYFLLNTFGWNWTSRLLEYTVVENLCDHELYGIKPKHRFLSQHPTTNDYVHTKILSGRINVRPNIGSFTEHGVVFEKSDSITPIDAVVFATGYRITFPFIKESFAEIKENEVNFYKNIFPLELNHPTLAFIGLCQPNGAIMPIADMQCQWFAMLMQGKVKLPSPEKIVQKVHQDKKALKERFVVSPRHTISVDFLPYLDSIAVEFGAKPNLLKMMFTDPIFALMCILGPCLPYQYRLEGPHAWEGAKDAILNLPTRITKPLSSGLTNPRYSHFELLKFALPILFFMLSLMLNIYVILTYFF